MTEMFEVQAAEQTPSAQTAAEYRASVNDFVEYLGDIPATQVAWDDSQDTVAVVSLRSSGASPRLSKRLFTDTAFDNACRSSHSHRKSPVTPR